jgi:hypothetical protein
MDRAHGHRAWTCSRYMDLVLYIDWNIDLDMDTDKETEMDMHVDIHYYCTGKLSQFHMQIFNQKRKTINWRPAIRILAADITAILQI